MKYGIYKLEAGQLIHHFLAELNSKDVEGMEAVATAKTKREANEIAKRLGQAL